MNSDITLVHAGNTIKSTTKRAMAVLTTWIWLAVVTSQILSIAQGLSLRKLITGVVQQFKMLKLGGNENNIENSNVQGL